MTVELYYTGSGASYWYYKSNHGITALSPTVVLCVIRITISPTASTIHIASCRPSESLVRWPVPGLVPETVPETVPRDGPTRFPRGSPVVISISTSIHKKLLARCILTSSPRVLSLPSSTCPPLSTPAQLHVCVQIGFWLAPWPPPGNRGFNL